MTIHPGFTGTFTGFIDWLSRHLTYGDIRIADEPCTDDLGRLRRRVTTTTGGFSDDERLLGRVENSLMGVFYWSSSHRGGLTIYDVPEEHMSQTNEFEWLKEYDDELILKSSDIHEIIVNDLHKDRVVINQLHITGIDQAVVIYKEGASLIIEQLDGMLKKHQLLPDTGIVPADKADQIRINEELLGSLNPFPPTKAPS